MKRLGALLIVLLFVAASCMSSGPLYEVELSGNSYGVISPREITIHRSPSLKGEVYRLNEAEIFVVGDIVCAKGTIKYKCYVDLVASEDAPGFAESAFYKVLFASGEEGYISARYLYPKLSDLLVSEEAAERRGTTLEEYTSRLWRDKKRVLVTEEEEFERLKESKSRRDKRRQGAIVKAPWPEAEKTRILDGEVWEGMSADQLKLSQDLPVRIKRTPGVKGVYERWFYEDRVYTIKSGKVDKWESITPAGPGLEASKKGHRRG